MSAKRIPRNLSPVNLPPEATVTEAYRPHPRRPINLLALLRRKSTREEA